LIHITLHRDSTDSQSKTQKTLSFLHRTGKTALKIEIKDLFEFAHLQAGGVKIEEIEQLLAGADEEKKRMIMKIVRAVVR
jgi:hypothetical protein